ncbi:MAG: tryptophanase [Candidatus Heimdallarchaeota archaeon]|nr:tryptophanase [Candidatus Heimdallarchaeota archaeon]
MVKYNPPPYRIKMVEPIELPSVEERHQAIKEANYNVFNLKASQIFMDLLTDSGTGAMSHGQWASMMKGDESYANAKSFYRIKDVVKRLTGFEEFIPAHQGRAAENILFGHLLQNKAGQYVVSNQSFDTTVGHILYNKAKPIDIVIEEGKSAKTDHPFKGNMDTSKLQEILTKEGEKVEIITLVLTNNAGGGQPVSMANIKEVYTISKANNKPFYMDIARFIENAYFIQQREEGYKNKSLSEILLEMGSFCDGMWMSAKKDAYVNIGGFIALRDKNLADKLRERLIMFEGFPTYGGLAGRDLEAMATGLEEAVEGSVVAHRVNQIEYLVRRLDEEGIPVVLPPGGHAGFIDAGEFLPHIPAEQFPAQALCIELYLRGGIRAVEIGSLMFGHEEDGKFIPATMELVRLTIPRRTYEKAHFDYLIDILIDLKSEKDKIKGLKIVEEPEFLRHFTCKLAPVD